MSVRNVTWKRLLLEKRRGESFTEVLERILPAPRKEVKAFLGGEDGS